MQRFFFLLFLGLGSINLLHSDEKGEQPASVTPEAPPASFVNSVHVVSGTFYFSTNELTLPGPIPLNVSHHYNSETSFRTWMGHSPFASNFPVSIRAFEFEVDDSEHAKNGYAVVEEANGSMLSLAARVHMKKDMYYFMRPSLNYQRLYELQWGRDFCAYEYQK